MKIINTVPSIDLKSNDTALSDWENEGGSFRSPLEMKEKFKKLFLFSRSREFRASSI